MTSQDLPVAKPRSNGTAVTALVLGIVSFVIGVWSPIPVIGVLAAMLAIVPAVLAVAFGHVGLSRAREIDGVGRGPALAGLWTGYIALGIIVLTTLGWIVGSIIAGVGAAVPA